MIKTNQFLEVKVNLARLTMLKMQVHNLSNQMNSCIKLGVQSDNFKTNHLIKHQACLLIKSIISNIASRHSSIVQMK